jgi:hypothetical protein
MNAPDFVVMNLGGRKPWAVVSLAITRWTQGAGEVVYRYVSQLAAEGFILREREILRQRETDKHRDVMARAWLAAVDAVGELPKES